MLSLRRLAIAAVGSAMLASVVSAPADAQWRRGYGGWHGGWGHGGWYGWRGYHYSAPVWPWAVAGGLIGLGVLGALTAPPPVYYAPPPVFYAPPPAYFPPPGYFAAPPGYFAPRP
ncbi:MAG: hypothetical protein JOZ17_27040 [Acetobacteraceae bacterium]|nr:hypothetical protein [Acetobacteraceae bacterium]